MAGDFVVGTVGVKVAREVPVMEGMGAMVMVVGSVKGVVGMGGLVAVLGLVVVVMGRAARAEVVVD